MIRLKNLMLLPLKIGDVPPMAPSRILTAWLLLADSTGQTQYCYGIGMSRDRSAASVQYFFGVSGTSLPAVPVQQRTNRITSFLVLLRSQAT